MCRINDDKEELLAERDELRVDGKEKDTVRKYKDVLANAESAMP